MSKHCEDDQDNLSIPKPKQTSPDDVRPLPTGAGNSGTLPSFSISANLPQLNNLAIQRLMLALPQTGHWVGEKIGCACILPKRRHLKRTVVLSLDGFEVVRENAPWFVGPTC